MDLADGIVLLTKAFAHLQEKSGTVQKEAAKHGLRINVEKTKTLTLGQTHQKW